MAGAVLGLDGCPGGWVAARVTDAGAVTWHVAPDAADLLRLAADVAGVDIPIGLPATGRRAADQAARDRLGPARSSVFYAPPRSVLDADTYERANALCRRDSGHGLSTQTWHLVPRIRQVDALLTDRVVEVHPEVSFRALDPRVDARKTTGRGVGQRLRALAGRVDTDVLADLPAGVPVDDALDALAVAWTARRYRDGQAETLPDPFPRDAFSVPMRIVV